MTFLSPVGLATVTFNHIACYKNTLCLTIKNKSQFIFQQKSNTSFKSLLYLVFTFFLSCIVGTHVVCGYN